MVNAVTSKPMVRAHAGLQFAAFLVVLVLIGALVWYFQSKRQLVCAGAAEASWHLAYVDGKGVSKFMWVIEPQSEGLFTDCLKNSGFDVSIDKNSGLVQAEDDQGFTISNSIGDGFTVSGKYYKW
jgi:hypothetical protein